MSFDANNKDIVRRYIEAWLNGGDEPALESTVSPDWISHGTQSASAAAAPLPRGVAGAKKLHDDVRTIWPDNHWTIEDMLADGDKVAVRMTTRATHRGAYRGIPATGKQVVFSSIWIFRLADGRIAEAWRSADDLGRIIQIGGMIVPTPA